MPALHLSSHARPNTGARSPLPTAPDGNFWPQAACAGFMDNTLYPKTSRNAATTIERTEAAKIVCNGMQVDGDYDIPGCPVRAQCLAYALTNNEIYGVWGGMSPEDREHHTAAVSA